MAFKIGMEMLKMTVRPRLQIRKEKPVMRKTHLR